MLAGRSKEFSITYNFGAATKFPIIRIKLYTPFKARQKVHMYMNIFNIS